MSAVRWWIAANLDCDTKELHSKVDKRWLCEGNFLIVSSPSPRTSSFILFTFQQHGQLEASSSLLCLIFLISYWLVKKKDGKNLPGLTLIGHLCKFASIFQFSFYSMPFFTGLQWHCSCLVRLTCITGQKWPPFNLPFLPNRPEHYITRGLLCGNLIKHKLKWENVLFELKSAEIIKVLKWDFETGALKTAHGIETRREIMNENHQQIEIQTP